MGPKVRVEGGRRGQGRGPKPRKGRAPKGGAPKGGAPKGGAPKGGAQRVGPRISCFFFRPPGLSHDSPTKIPREDPQRDTETAKRWRERKRKSEILGGPAEGVQWRGVRRKVVQGSPNQQQPQQPTTTTTPNPEQVGPHPLSQTRFGVFRLGSTTQQQH